MQPAAYSCILRPFCRSAEELHATAVPVEYQVETLFINFPVSTAKKGCRQGPGSGNLLKTQVKATISQQQGWHRNHIKITQWKPIYYVFTPCLFWDRIWIRPRIRGRLVEDFPNKSKSWRSYFKSYRGGDISALWIVTTIAALDGWCNKCTGLHRSCTFFFVICSNIQLYSCTTSTKFST